MSDPMNPSANPRMNPKWRAYLIAMLAIVRKLLIFDLAGGEAIELFALAAAILALGGVYWLVRDRETRDAAPPG